MPSPSSPAEVCALWIDASTGAARVALLQGAEVLSLAVGENPRGGSRELPELVARALADQPPPGLVLVAPGPGSFTGIRVGLAFARGFARGRGLGLRGLDGLATLAACAPEGEVTAAVDALRGEAYARRFRVQGGLPEPLDDPGLRPWETLEGPVYAPAGRRLPEGVTTLEPAALARGAAALWAAGRASDPTPVWTRRSWAEEAGRPSRDRANLLPGTRE
jgi:tRNA threonylcarbamoyl adenosine modification protein YeaZ